MARVGEVGAGGVSGGQNMVGYVLMLSFWGNPQSLSNPEKWKFPITVSISTESRK
jgi:hypothetical protein